MVYRLRSAMGISWQAKAALVVALIVSMSGCAGSGARLADQDSQRAAIYNQLPPLPQDTPDARNPSAIQMDSFAGADVWDSTPGTMIDGDHLQLPAAAGDIEWSMYRYTLPSMDSTLDNIAAEQSSTGGDGAWVAVSDYGHDTWVLSGPYTGNTEVALAGGDFISALNYFYVLVIAFDGTTTDLASTTLTYDDNAAPAVTYAGAGGAREFFAAHCFSCHSAAVHTSGVVLESYNGASAVASTAKSQVQSDHMGSYSNEDKDLIAAWADGGAQLGDAVHYTTDMRPLVFAPVCMNCHDSSKTGVERNGAPASVNWDTYAAATTGDQPNHGNNRAQAGTMPPALSGLSLTQAQKDLFQEWIDDGWPE
jgi:hypothetical protein